MWEHMQAGPIPALPFPSEHGGLPSFGACFALETQFCGWFVSCLWARSPFCPDERLPELNALAGRGEAPK